MYANIDLPSKLHIIKLEVRMVFVVRLNQNYKNNLKSTISEQKISKHANMHIPLERPAFYPLNCPILCHYRITVSFIPFKGGGGRNRQYDWLISVAVLTHIHRLYANQFVSVGPMFVFESRFREIQRYVHYGKLALF